MTGQVRVGRYKVIHYDHLYDVEMSISEESSVKGRVKVKVTFSHNKAGLIAAAGCTAV